MTATAQATVAAGSDWRASLAERGWVVVPDVPDPRDAERLLQTLGVLLEQYNGAVRHQVRARPGFEALQYSQSRNGITPHTEAPGMRRPPRYLALHCHRQARCGGGQTLLADGYAFAASLPEPLAAQARERLIRFDLATGARDGGRVPHAAPLLAEGEPHADGRTPIVRFSYNVLRDNSLNAPVHEDLNDVDELDPFNAELCRRCLDFVRTRGCAALPADGSLLIFDNWRMLHARDAYSDPDRHLTRYWVG
jgi:alpha-ketoglutarate-dependent taurine dioxygenase